MASISKIGGKWRALIRRKGYSPVSRYFQSKKEADAWAREVEVAIDKNSPSGLNTAPLSVFRAVEVYRDVRMAAARPVAPESNEHYMLQHLAADLGPELVADLTPQRLMRWAAGRKAEGAGGYTVNMELSKLGTVLRTVASYLSIALPDVVGSARPLLRNLQLIGGSHGRARRPTEDEITRLLAIFDGPMRDAVQVSLTTGLRRGELCKIRWADLMDEDRAVLVRQRKHPRSTQRRDEPVPLLGEAWEIVQRQPQVDERIFPFDPGTLSKKFKRACNSLGIADLRWHDLRHEASSKLREKGFEAVERQAILGHATEKMNARYTHVKLRDLHRKYDS